MTAALAEAWPLLGLRLVCDDLTLAPASDADVLALADLVENGIVDPGDERFLPHLLCRRAATADGRRRAFLQWHWGVRAKLAPESWRVRNCSADRLVLPVSSLLCRLRRGPSSA